MPGKYSLAILSELKSVPRTIGLIILGLLAIALLIASLMGFYYGLVLAGSGKDLIGGILLTILCNTSIFVIYQVGKQFLFPHKLNESKWR